MKKYEVNASTFIKVKIDSNDIANIIEKELRNVLGGSDRFIENGSIKERDYRFNGADEIRPATPEEINLWESFWLVNKHFRNLN